MSDTPLVQLDSAAVSALYDRVARDSSSAGSDVAHASLSAGFRINDDGVQVVSHVHHVKDAFAAWLEGSHTIKSATLSPRDIRADSNGRAEMFGTVFLARENGPFSAEFHAVIPEADTPRNTRIELWSSATSGPTSFIFHKATGAIADTPADESLRSDIF